MYIISVVAQYFEEPTTMALCGHCFGSTDHPLSINNHPFTRIAINKTQYIVIAFHECGLLYSYACRKMGQICQIA